MRSRINIKKKIIVSLFFIIIGGIIFNSTFFLHSHRTACGKIIVHAHPFKKDAEKENPLTKHNHNKIDLDYISSFSYFVISKSSIKLDFVAEYEIEILSKPGLLSISKLYLSYPTRGPPVSLA